MAERTTTLQTDFKPRCWRCNRVLAIRLSRPWEMRCRRCKAANVREVGVSLQQVPEPLDKLFHI